MSKWDGRGMWIAKGVTPNWGRKWELDKSVSAIRLPLQHHSFTFGYLSQIIPSGASHQNLMTDPTLGNKLPVFTLVSFTKMEILYEGLSQKANNKTQELKELLISLFLMITR